MKTKRTFLQFLGFTLAFSLASMAFSSEKSPPRGRTVVYDSNTLKINEVPLGQRNPVVLSTDHKAVAERVSRQKQHTNNFWDEFYLNEQVTLWLNVNYIDTQQNRRSYRHHTQRIENKSFNQNWQQYVEIRQGNKPVETILRDKEFKEWLYVMYQMSNRQPASSATSN
ncbi:MAG: hypothetical protein P8Q37_06445 [Porticoccaceae bacterium]|nr:hypothetical protein [Porticoccaceae bacterium]MDG1474524.1 hypothetical protein [Porticoccaceae bacterium]